MRHNEHASRCELSEVVLGPGEEEEKEEEKEEEEKSGWLSCISLISPLEC